ncbi:YihY/virulence factor BrkB family protein [Streptomyces sp. HPF1205]|uniref:YihY/virulence factor BrkB family protein n=1 Tax=Streptomyces sp. HPF1205 TaxID=2873262 RepID=UPI001CED271F|nr:YihY/virulence factor BrkB family protein [Streptomyces sp. HPF1205]
MATDGLSGGRGKYGRKRGGRYGTRGRTAADTAGDAAAGVARDPAGGTAGSPARGRPQGAATGAAAEQAKEGGPAGGRKDRAGDRPPAAGRDAQAGGGRGRGLTAGFRRVRTLVRAIAAAWDKDATERAAALTYYAVLALFPSLLLTLSVVGLTGSPDGSGVPGGLEVLMPRQSRPLVADTLRQMAQDVSATTSLAALSGVGAAWAACSYAAVFRRALHHIHGVEDHRPAWRTAPRVVLTALMLLVLLVASTVCVVVSGQLAHRVGDLLHLGGAVVSAWRSLRWPVLLVVAAVSVLILFRSGPRGTRGLRAVAPGGAVAVGLWLLTSAGFAAYSARMGTYNRLYGPLSGAVAFLVWLWLTNLALIIGAHYNAERFRLLAAGEPAGGGEESQPGADTGPDRRASRRRAPVSPPASAAASAGRRTRSRRRSGG